MPCRYKAIPPAITSAPRISGASTHFANQTKDRVKRRTVSLDIRSSQRLRNREARYCRRGYYFTLHQCARVDAYQNIDHYNMWGERDFGKLPSKSSQRFLREMWKMPCDQRYRGFGLPTYRSPYDPPSP